MAIELPKPIADYFEADKGPSAEAIAACFTSAAVVRDEGHTYAGRDAIRRWKNESSAKYTYTGEPFSIADEDGCSIPCRDALPASACPRTGHAH